MNRLVNKESDWIHQRICETVGFKQGNKMMLKGREYDHYHAGPPEYFEGENNFWNTLRPTSQKGLGQVIGYSDDLKRDLKERIVIPRKLKVATPFTYLLFGPSSADKTYLVDAIAKDLHMKVLHLSPSDILDEYVGTGPNKIRKAFEVVKQKAPCVIFFDEMEVLFPDRRYPAVTYGNTLVSQFKVEWDHLSDFNDKYPDKQVLVMGSSAIPTIIDESCRSRISGYFYVPLPTKEQRKGFLVTSLGTEVTRSLVDAAWNRILTHTDAFSYADLTRLCQDINLMAIQKVPGMMPRNIVACAGRRLPDCQDKRVIEVCKAFYNHLPTPAKFSMEQELDQTWNGKKSPEDRKGLLHAKNGKKVDPEVKRRVPKWWQEDFFSCLFPCCQ